MQALKQDRNDQNALTDAACRSRRSLIDKKVCKHPLYIDCIQQAGRNNTKQSSELQKLIRAFNLAHRQHSS